MSVVGFHFSLFYVLLEGQAGFDRLLWQALVPLFHLSSPNNFIVDLQDLICSTKVVPVKPGNFDVGYSCFTVNLCVSLYNFLYLGNLTFLASGKISK